MADTVAITRLGPRHAGHRMSLREFREIEFEEGYQFELGQGVVIGAEVPSVFHMLIVLAIRDALVGYRLAHPSRIFAVTGGAESGVEMPEMESRRHPDVSVYLTPPPTADAQPWETWTPEIAVEVVSESSRKRDFEDKADEYLRAGVRLYWIIDPANRSATVLTRRADGWLRQTIDTSGELSTGMLPGLTLPLATVFAVLN